MKIWIDSTNTTLIKKGVRMGILYGVTTNPKIIASQDLPPEPLIDQLLNMQEGPITVQVVAETAEEMIRQGQRLYYHSNRIIIKIPVTENGYVAIHRLSRASIPTMATAIFTPHQALVAAECGADYVAPYLSRMGSIGLDPIESVMSMKKMFLSEHYETEVLAASISNLDDMILLAQGGIDAITLKDELFEKVIGNHPKTEEIVEEFKIAWDENNQPLSQTLL